MPKTLLLLRNPDNKLSGPPGQVPQNRWGHPDARMPLDFLYAFRGKGEDVTSPQGSGFPTMSAKARYRILIGVLLVAALIVRLGALAKTTSAPTALESSYEHAEIAENIAEGRGFTWTFFCPLGQSVPTSQQAPLVPYVLAGTYVLFGVQSAAAIWSLLILQSLVSTLTVWAVAESTRCMTGRDAAAFAAGAVACLYPPLVASALHIQALVWNLAFLAFALWGILELLAGRSLLGTLLFVPAAIGAWHSDPIIGGACFALLGSLAFGVIRSPWRAGGRGRGGERENERRRRHGFAAIATCAFAIAVGLAPWTIRNYHVHGRWMAIKDSLPYVFWQGNTAASQGSDKLLVSEESIDLIQSSRDATASAFAAHAVRQQTLSVNQSLPPEFVAYVQSLPTEVERMDAFGSRIRAELTSHPWQYFEKCGLRLQQWLWFDATNPRSFLWSYRASYLSLALLSLGGLWISRRQLASMAPLLVAAAALTLVHVLVIGSARFRIPLEMLLIPFAAAPLEVGVRALLHYPCRYGCLFASSAHPPRIG